MCDLNPAIQIILTVDYEIFGNGQGDVKKLVIEPVDRLMQLGDRFGVSFTIFFDVEEYCAFLKYRDELVKHTSYDPAGLMAGQVRELVKR